MVVHTLYSFLWRLILPLAVLRLFWRSLKQPAYRQRIAERLGFCPPAPKPNGILLHTVSVGEFLAAKPLLHALLEQYPDDVITVTTMTPTGSARVQELGLPRVHHVYFPYDTPGAMRRFFARIQPRMMVVMETELWLNAFTEAERQQVPVYVVNARLSEKSARGYGRFSHFSKMLLDRITHLAVQAEADTKRFLALGMAEERLSICGSIKYDMKRDPAIVEQGEALRTQLGRARPVWIAASTREGEDKLVLQAYATLRNSIPTLCLVLVPRHPERFQQAATQAAKLGFVVAKRSEHKVNQSAVSDIDVYVGDTMGELPILYAAADVAFVGGSLVPTGGHNVLEPLVYGKPTVVGPHVFNFATICQELLAADGLVQVEGVDDLAPALAKLFADEQEMRRLLAGAEQVLVQSRGCLQRLMRLFTV